MRSRVGVGLLVLGLVLSSLGIGLARPTAAQVSLLAEVRLRGGILPDTTVGGAGETFAEWADASDFSDSIHSRNSGGELRSNTAQGLMDGSIFSEIFIPLDFLRGSDFVQMFLSQVDTYTIGPGTSGLSNGDPVQVRVEARANTTLVLKGNASASSGLLFNVEGVPGVPGRWIDWQIGGLNPPQDLEFREYWEIVVDTTVGSSFTLRTNLEAQIGVCTFEGPMEEGEPERNDATGVALLRVSSARGYEKIEVSSQAGAPATPIVPVPALSPLGLVTLATVLAGMVLLLLARSPAKQIGSA